MTATPEPRPRGTDRRPAPGLDVVLVLQGGGALGAYEAGACTVFMAAGYEPGWIAGISIGAVNAALIAGNPPARRAAALREFWKRVATGPDLRPFLDSDIARGLFREVSALGAVVAGVPAFFTPRVPPPWLRPSGSVGATSFYDPAPLRATLGELIDFDFLAAGGPRLSLGAVDVTTGESVYFESRERRLGPEHVLASGALPPGFPPVEVEGALYWDGGLVSNTPLDHVLADGAQRDRLVFQVDVFSARGRPPRDIMDVLARQKEIVYASRSRRATDSSCAVSGLRRNVRQLLRKLPPELAASPEAAALERDCREPSTSLIHLIYTAKNYESHWSDYEFSRTSMDAHWQAGVDDATRALEKAPWLEPPAHAGLRTFPLTSDGPA